MEIIQFNEENFANQLCNDCTLIEAVKAKYHYKYFLEYLGSGLHAQYMVIEDGYISKDYLHDYISYYALCFKGYKKDCKRVHFFSTTLTRELFEKALLNKLDSPLDIWNSYLGFIVVKPIPTTIIGYSVLKNYNFVNELEDRYFWGLREYAIHVFGHEVKFKSLAFQEQDTVLAACATTAIWCMLNKAAVDFHTVLKSPSDITKDAGNVSPDGSRLFPNKGLDVAQICHAILKSGLVTELKQADVQDTNENWYVSNVKTKKIINAYSGLGIPIILVIEVPDGSDHGLHAVTVSGFKRLPVEPASPGAEVGWLANNIEKLYAHDDQFGPFVRITFKDNCKIETPWTERHKDGWPTRVTNIIIPVYPKVRISYEDVEAIVDGLDTILTGFFKGKNLYDLVWDIQLHYSESFKSKVNDLNLSDQEKITLLTNSMPKYLWVATCYIGKFEFFTLTFDATDVINGMIGRHFLCFLPVEYKIRLLSYLSDNREKLEQAFYQTNPRYFTFLIEELGKQINDSKPVKTD